MAGVAKSVAAAREMLQKKMSNGEALEKFGEMIEAQGGDRRVCEDLSRLPVAKHTRPIPALKSGSVQSIECDQLGYAVIALGGGRKMASDQIDFGVGFEHPKKVGAPVKSGEPLTIMQYSDDGAAKEAERMVQQAYKISEQSVTKRPQLIVQRIE